VLSKITKIAILGEWFHHVMKSLPHARGVVSSRDETTPSAFRGVVPSRGFTPPETARGWFHHVMKPLPCVDGLEEWFHHVMEPPPVK